MIKIASLIFQRYSNTFLSTWTVLLADVLFIMLLYPLAVLIRFNFEVEFIAWTDTFVRLPIVIFTYLAFFFITGSYRGVIRQTGLRDATIITKALAFACVSLLLISGFNTLFSGPGFLSFSKAILLIHFLISLFVLLFTRLFIRAIFYRLKEIAIKNTRAQVLIFGSGELGEITRKSLAHERNVLYKLYAFLDDNPTKQGKYLDGVPVLQPEEALNNDFIRKNGIKVLFLAVNYLSPLRKKELIERCIQLKLETKIVPPFESWIQNNFSFKDIKSVAIEDLLGRATIKLDDNTIAKEIKNKRILITGAAGSIGAELAKQFIVFQPEQLVLLDIAESSLYELQMDLQRNYPKLYSRCEFIVQDITRYNSIKDTIENYQPEIIYHAAAYKHVPLMEKYPEEAARVNIIGTKYLVDLAFKHCVYKFVMVSTDKAVNPTNVMGATKRISEMYVQNKSKDPRCKTQFITTRFGNVLGSNGSVVPQFRKQIENGGPILVTHPDITRYFMTIQEACRLVIEAGAIGSNGEILLFDMGEPIKINDLAIKMIRLMGFEEYKDIDIQYTGLRPGEKINEELLYNKEEHLPTHHEKIMIARIQNVDSATLQMGIFQIEQSLVENETWNLVRQMKLLLPEYISNNSEFTVLDETREFIPSTKVIKRI